MSWTAIEKTLHDMVMTGLGLTGDKVVWISQTAPRLPQPYATLKRTSPQPLGTTVERTTTYDGAQSAGAEIIQTTKDHVEFVLSLQVYTAPVVGDATAMALLEQVQDQAVKASQQDAFRTAGVALVSRGTIQNVSELLNTLFEGRAALDMTFRVARSATENTGYITEVDVAETISSVTTTQNVH